MTQVKFAYKWNYYGHRPETSYRELERLAVASEDLGYDGVYVVDHLYLPSEGLRASSGNAPSRPFFPEAWTCLAAVAAVTKRVKIGPQVTPISLRHPVFIAKMAANLDFISNGRLILQVGTGWHREEFENYGFEWDEKFSVRYEKMLEGVEMIKRLWTSEEPVSYEGKYYTLTDAPMWPKPVQKPRPPIWFGGLGKKVRTATAKYGEGWTPAMPHAGGISPEVYAEYWAEIQAMAESEGRKKDEIVGGGVFFISIDRDRTTALERAARVLSRKDWSFTMEELLNSGTIIAGNPDDCARRIQEYIDAGLTYFSVCFPPLGDLEGSMRGLELFSQEIFPKFQS